MNQNDPIADLNEIIADDRRAYKKETFILLAWSLGLGSAVSLALYLFTSLPLFGDVMCGGLVYVVLWVLLIGSADDQRLSDLALGKLATAEVHSTEALKKLKIHLEHQRFLTLDQVEIFLSAELQERIRLESLNSPGAKSLLS